MQFYAAFRSNAFKVKDTFQHWIGQFPEIDVRRDGDRIQIAAAGCIPDQALTEAGYQPVDFLAELSKHVADNDVCIVYEIGFSDDLKETAAYAIAIRGGKEPFKERFVALDLNSIEKMAKKRFALPVAA